MAKSGDIHSLVTWVGSETFTVLESFEVGPRSELGAPIGEPKRDGEL